MRLLLLIIFTAAVYWVFFTQDERHNFTQAFDNSQGGYSIGNGCIENDPNNFITYWEYDGDLDLTEITLSLNNANLKVNGSLLYNGVEFSEDQMIALGRLKKNCNDPLIIFA